MTIDPSLLHVSETSWGDVAPRAANLHVNLKADRLFSGAAAFVSAQELRRLVVALTAQGVPEEATSLQGAALDISEGLFSRSSSVTYRVRIRLEDLELLAGTIDAISECKRATLTSIEWDYRGGATSALLLAESADRALVKARALAAALGTTIEGIHEVHEEELSDQPVARALVQPRFDDRERVSCAKVGTELAGLDLAPTKKIGVCVRVACRISRSNS